MIELMVGAPRPAGVAIAVCQVARVKSCVGVDSVHQWHTSACCEGLPSVWFQAYDMPMPRHVRAAEEACAALRPRHLPF
jgi:hypothetical protein